MQIDFSEIAEIFIENKQNRHLNFTIYSLLTHQIQICMDDNSARYLYFNAIIQFVGQWCQRNIGNKELFYLDARTRYIDASAFLDSICQFRFLGVCILARNKIHGQAYVSSFGRVTLSAPNLIVVSVLSLTYLLSKSGHVLISVTQVYILTTT